MLTHCQSATWEVERNSGLLLRQRATYELALRHFAKLNDAYEAFALQDNELLHSRGIRTLLN